MLKRVFPDRQQKSSGRNNSTKQSGSSSPSPSTGGTDRNRGSPQNHQLSSSENIGHKDNLNESGGVITTTPVSSANSSPLKSSIGLTTSSRHSSSASSSPVKSEGQGGTAGEGGRGQGTGTTNLAKLKHISRSCSSTEFQSLKLESMSTVEDFKSVSKTISSNLERDGMLTKQSSSGPPGSGNETHESTSLSTPSDEDGEAEPTESLFKQQAKFFYQMKEYLLSQQSSLRQHLELLNATVASRKKKVTARRQQRFLNSGHSVHLAAKPKPEVTPEIRGNNHDLDLMNEFHSCSSTEKSDEDIQVCPLCGVEIEDSENPAALEEHVASHWCSPDDPI